MNRGRKNSIPSFGIGGSGVAESSSSSQSTLPNNSSSSSSSSNRSRNIMMTSSSPRGRGSGGGKRRRRRPPSHFTSSTAAEERFLQQAIQNSKLDVRRPVDGRLSVHQAPTFFPTVADFEGNPLDYVEKIRPVAERYGICKIVPPVGWHPAPFCANGKSTDKFETKLQHLHRLQEGISFGDGQDCTVEHYQDVASRRTQEWKTKHYPDHDLLSRHADVLESNSNNITNGNGNNITNSNQEEEGSSDKKEEEATHDDRHLFTPENLERDYWEIVEARSKECSVEYGNDVDTSVFGSGFPLSERGRSINGTKNPKKMAEPEPKFGTEDYYKETFWNLNNIPCAPNSVLRHVRVGINGINVPWMYYGSLFTTFCWHNEDNYLYSINYHHRGAPKQWYGVPGSKDASDGLEKVFKSFLSMKMRDVPDLLHHITTMFSPRLLQNANVPVYKTLQHEGEFVITFPRAFHGGFSLGPNVGEAVNFATHDWIHYGADANERYRSFSRPAVFSHDRLTFTMANHLQEQTSYATCKLLLQEVERVVDEELRLRRELLEAGVRDVSKLISLPNNRLDQLDERSASYDDRRLCHACRHICFFSAVACECSQSRVSCLRHSHYMCRCPTGKKYFMIWSTEDELTSTLDRVRNHCEDLRSREEDNPTKAQVDAAAAAEAKSAEPLPSVAPGSEEDYALHKDDEISTGGFLDDAYKPSKSVILRSLASSSSAGVAKRKDPPPGDAMQSDIATEEKAIASKGSGSIVSIEDDEDDPVEVLFVTRPQPPVPKSSIDVRSIDAGKSSIDVRSIDAGTGS